MGTPWSLQVLWVFYVWKREQNRSMGDVGTCVCCLWNKQYYNIPKYPLSLSFSNMSHFFSWGQKKRADTTKTEFSYFGLKRLPTNKTVRSHLLSSNTVLFCWPSSTVRRRNGQVQLPRSHLVQQRFGEAVHVPTQSRWDAQIRSGVRKSFRISRMWGGVNFFDESKGVWRQTRLYLTPNKTSCITMLTCLQVPFIRLGFKKIAVSASNDIDRLLFDKLNTYREKSIKS